MSPQIFSPKGKSRALNRNRGARVHDGRGLAELSQEFAETVIPVDGVSFEDYYKSLQSRVFGGCANLRAPTCVGHMTAVPPAFFGQLAAQIVSLNQNVVKFEASRACTMLERQVIAMLHRATFRESEQIYTHHAQNGTTALGVLTSGGSLSNITALWVARDRALGPKGRFAGVGVEGLGRALRAHGFRSAVIVGSELAHYSLTKAAGALGLGSNAFIPVPVRADRGVDVPALARVLDANKAARNCVLAIIGIAGTTDCGSVDPLAEMAHVAEERGVHFHVDAAWGFPLLLSELHGPELRGIERANSVTIDGHKQFYMPLGSSVLLFRRPTDMQAVEQRAQYMLHDGSGDLGKFSLEGSRPCAAIFWDAGLRVFGTRGYASLIEQNIGKARRFAAAISAREDFELLTQPRTNIVLYRWLPPGYRSMRGGPYTEREACLLDACTEQVQKIQSAAGHSYVSRTQIRRRDEHENGLVMALRAVILNPYTTERDLEGMLDEQSALGGRIWMQLVAATSESL